MPLFDPNSVGAIKQYAADDISAPAIGQRKWWQNAATTAASNAATAATTAAKDAAQPPERLGREHAGPAAGTPLILYAPGRDAPERARARVNELCALQTPIALFLAIETLRQVVEIATAHHGPHGRIEIGRAHV